MPLIHTQTNTFKKSTNIAPLTCARAHTGIGGRHAVGQRLAVHVDRVPRDGREALGRVHQPLDVEGGREELEVRLHQRKEAKRDRDVCDW